MSSEEDVSENVLPQDENYVPDQNEERLIERQQMDLVKKLYKDLSFSGSYSGISNLQRTIFLEKGLHLSKNLITKAVNEIPTYVQHLRSRKKFERSHYDVSAFGEVCQMDLAIMFDFNGYSCFFLLIELFSHRIFTRPQKTKTAKETLKSLKSVIAEGEETSPDGTFVITTIQSDQGKEFIGLQNAFKKMKIHWTVKVGPNKASYAEQVRSNSMQKTHILKRFFSGNWTS
jgi:hypothetical protein